VEEGFQEQSEATGLLPSQEDVCMHLTNYAINKHNENFVRDDAVGSKRYSLLCFPLFPLPLSPHSLRIPHDPDGSWEAD
jgi:hypothetical protein